ncbi:MAG: hypothetical protein ABI963_00605 [Rhizomicrobium sp.]
MIRTASLAALTVVLMSATAFAQSNAAPNGPPAQLSNPNSYDDRYDGPDQRDDQRYDQRYDQRAAPPQQTAQDQRSRDLFCRRDAAARTGYVTPGQAAGHEQANGTILGTLGGAAVGALIGGAAGNAGAGAAIGAGAGLIGGTAVGADNARRAAADVERDYASAYYACMGEADNGPDGKYAYGPPPAPGSYYGPPPPPSTYYGYGPAPYPYPYYPYYGPAYGPAYGPSYGPSVGFSFGFGGRGGWGHGGRGRH